MKVGLLIYDDDPSTSLSEKVIKAAHRHRRKYETEPSICYVHREALSKTYKLEGIVVSSCPTVLKNHLWIGRK